jgi:argininosuccinate synthase
VYARSCGCDTIAHGCTGKGNDQVRIEATVATLAPELKVIAPVRSWQMGREEEIAYAREHGIPVKGGTEVAPYSIDDNLWGRSSEGRWIEQLDHPGRRRRRTSPSWSSSASSGGYRSR